MPGNVRTVAWVTREGKRRRIRLYEVWVNLRGRITGGKSVNPGYWSGVRNEFFDWPSFRAWALRNGYRKGMSLDRINEYKDYAPDNCQFLSKADHARKSTATRMKNSHNAGCMCRRCIERRKTIVYTPPSSRITIDPEVGF